MIQEVNALRQIVSEKLQAANEKLADVKELAMGYRQTIKNNFPSEFVCLHVCSHTKNTSRRKPEGNHTTFNYDFTSRY